MDKLLEKPSEHFGVATPFLYAALAYGFFHWLDEKGSDEAKSALARTMRFKDYKNEQVASALVEQFDRIYTYPLLRWRTFFRSLLFTIVVSGIWLFEFTQYIFDDNEMREFATNYWLMLLLRLFLTIVLSPMFLLFNVLTDYLSLFVIRPILVRSGAKPVIGLVLGAVSGVAIVLAASSLRTVFFVAMGVDIGDVGKYTLLSFFVPVDFDDWMTVLPALAVLVWLPLFALGILIVRLLTPLSWIVGRTQWFLRDGKEHPLKAIGYVAAVVVFIGTVAARAVFTT